MKRNYYFILLIFLFAIFNTKLFAQHVDAGDDFVVCRGETEVTLHPNIRPILTQYYTVESIPFQWDFDFSGTEVESMRTGTLSTLRDDDYSIPIDFPIDFYFLGNQLDKIVIGSNGDVVFNVIAGNQFDDYQYFDAGITIPNMVLPYWDDANMISADAVYGAAQDIHPGVRDNPGTQTTVQYKILGTAPNRKFVVTYNDIPLFGCTSGADLELVSQQIIFYETTDVIEVYIKQKPICWNWSHHAAAIGVQNGDIPDPCGVAAPGRNTGDWEVDASTPEAWRFVPTLTTSTVKWYNQNRDVVATTPEATVPFNPVNGQETFTLEIAFEDCHGNTFTEYDEVTVTELPEVQVQLPEEDLICQGETKVLDGSVVNASDYNNITYTWTDAAGTVLGTDAKLTITQPGVYTVTADVDNCIVSYTDNVVGYPYECRVPEGISPNGDNKNDRWVLDYLASQTGIDKVEIFDRRGVKVYEKSDYVHEFEGKDNDGTELPAATYYYVIKLLDGKKLTGWFYLAR